MPEEINKNIGEELVASDIDVNDDITEYLTDSSFEALKKRFGIAEEDPSIREEDFNPLTTGRAVKKPDNEIVTAPSVKKDDPAIDPSASLQNEFGTAESRFDNDAISFDEINIDLESLGSLVNDEESAKTDHNEEFNTNTRVIYEDKNADDGIKRNSDIEVSSVFSPD